MRSALVNILAVCPVLVFCQVGTLDSTFGWNGIAVSDFGGFDVPAGVVVQSDQKIVLAGSTGDGSTSLICVARYDTDGNPDPTFGINGVATTAVGSIYDEGDALAIDADAKILVAGTSNNGAYYEIVVLRYNSDGTLDPSFDGDGVAITNVGGGSIAYAMALQADGKILVGGVGNGANGPDFALVRYNADGTLDISFDGDGMVTTEISAGPDRVNALAVQPDGRIIAVGSFGDITPNEDLALVRYHSDGSLDTTFNEDGKATYGGAGDNENLRAVVLQPDGRIIAGGYSRPDSLGMAFILLGYDQNGTLDSSFGGDGVVATRIGYSSYGRDLVIQPDGKILVAGSANVDGNGSSFAMARYFGNGSLDTLFSDDGIVATPVGATSTCTALTIQSDGKVLLAGVAGVAPSGNFRVDRYMNDLEVGTVETDPRAMVWVAYPNPFINEAVLEFELASSETIACDLLDSQGRWIRTVFSNAILSRGRHREVLDLSSIAPGCYSLLLRSSEGNYGVRIVKQ